MKWYDTSYCSAWITTYYLLYTKNWVTKGRTCALDSTLIYDTQTDNTHKTYDVIHIYHSYPLDEFLKIKMLSIWIILTMFKIYYHVQIIRRKKLILHINASHNTSTNLTRNNWDSKWHKMNIFTENNLERTCRSCAGCLSVQKLPTAAHVCQRGWHKTPWYRLHIDYAGPFKVTMFLIVVDAHSKWPEDFPDDIYHNISYCKNSTYSICPSKHYLWSSIK